MRKFYLGLFLSLLTVTVWAETLIEVRNAQGQTQLIYISEDYARMEIQQQPTSYRLIDLKMHKAYIVNPAEKRYFDQSIMRLSQQTRPHNRYQNNQPPTVTAELVKVEAEPIEIAGYPAAHYQVKANGQTCSDIYISQQAAQVANIAQFDKAMETIQQQADMQQQHPCAQAHQDLATQIQTLGMQMKTVYAAGKLAGKVRDEVVSVKTDTEVSDDFFSLEGFTPLTAQEVQQMMQPRRYR